MDLPLRDEAATQARVSRVSRTFDALTASDTLDGDSRGRRFGIDGLASDLVVVRAQMRQLQQAVDRLEAEADRDRHRAEHGLQALASAVEDTTSEEAAVRKDVATLAVRTARMAEEAHGTQRALDALTDTLDHHAEGTQRALDLLTDTVDHHADLVAMLRGELAAALAPLADLAAVTKRQAGQILRLRAELKALRAESAVADASPPKSPRTAKTTRPKTR